MADRSTAETLELIRVAKDKEGMDSFIIKVMRQRGGVTMQTDHVVTVGDAQMVHIVNPEQWLPQLAGGGNFLLACLHASDPTRTIGAYIPVSIRADAKETDRASLLQTVGRSEWGGPREILFPAKDHAVRREAGTVIDVPPGAPRSAGVAPLRGSTEVETSGTRVGSSSSDGLVAVMTAQLEATRAELARIQQDRRDQEIRIREAELRREHDAEMHALKSQFAALSAKLETAAAAPKVVEAPKGPTLTEIIAGVLTAATPLIGKVLENQSAVQIAMLTREKENAASQTAMLQGLLNRPAMDPVLAELVRDIKSSMERASLKAGGDVAGMSEAMGTMTKTALSLVHAVADMNLGGGEQEHPAILAIREAVKGITAMVDGYKTHLKAQLAAGPKGAAAGQRPTPQPKTLNGANGAETPHEQPQQPRQRVGQPQGPEAQRAQEDRVMDLLEGSIKQKAPVEDVAAFLIKNIKDPGLEKAFMAVNGDLNELIASRLGDWIQVSEDNARYVAALFDAINEAGARPDATPEGPLWEADTGGEGGDDGVGEEMMPPPEDAQVIEETAN